MTKKNYVPLHNHTHYSTLDGYATVDEYIQVAVDLGLPGIGLADHGTASGLYKFIKRAQKAGITPVPGIEFYVAPENPLGAKNKETIYYGKGGVKAPKYDISRGAYTHLTVFAYNNVGLSNLFKLTSLSWHPDHFHYAPRIDTNMLAEHSEGLIVTTGCPSSEVSRRFLLGQDDKAYEYATRLKSIFGDNLYVEIMNHEMEDDELERILMPKQIKLARDLGLKLIATNDSHYAFQSDHKAHEVLLSIGTKVDMDVLPFHQGGNRFAFSTNEYHIKTYDEMLKVYPAEIAEEALANTLEVMEKCKGISLDYDSHLRPEIDIPKGYTNATYLQKLIYDGFVEKRGHESKETQAESVKRIREEFQVLHSNDFLSYFLVVHDYINFAHKNNIGVGAGRGSAGGSEIAYLLDITNTDPIRFDLLFERFLSPGRGSLYQIDYVSGESEEIAASDKKAVYRTDSEQVVYVHEVEPGDLINFNGDKKVVEKIFVKRPGSAPDIDTDFHTQRRDEIIQYCIDKYGDDKVANIITFGTFKTKSAFKAVAKSYGVPYARSNAISATIPGPPGVDVKLTEIFKEGTRWYHESADFRRAVDNPEMEKVIDVATQLDGRVSDTGIHPCGVIISNKPLAEHAPMMYRQEDGKMVSQWEYPELESLGFIKMDMLGLELIDTIQQTVENIKLVSKSENGKNIVVPNMRELIQGPMDDAKTYETLRAGHTVGIFQFGSPGVQELLRRAQPEKFMDIATVTALYRPGPMSMNSHLEWADRKNGAKDIVSIDSAFKGTIIEEILADTAGLLVFQESLMQIASRYALMTPYEADSLRKAMGKKDIKLMGSLQPKFIEGAVKNGSTKELASKVWETMEGFASYGFNKSHSVSYSINIYQTVYLKTHYPREFMAAVIQQGFGNPDKVREYIQEAVRMGLKLGHVDVNASQVQMASAGADPDSEYDIVFGFSGVKQVNNTLAQAIVDERNENGPYTSVADFAKRVQTRTTLTASPLASLANAGAFDSFGASRKLVADKAGMLIKAGAKQATAGTSLFDMMGGGAAITGVAESIEITGEEYDYNDLIKLEADRIGMFVSGHPTNRLGHIAKSYNAKKMEDILAIGGTRESFNVFGTVTHKKEKNTKSGHKSIAVLIDDGNTTEAVYLPRTITERIAKGEEIKRLDDARKRGITLRTNKRTEMILELVKNPDIKEMEPIELNEPYLFKITTRGWGDSVKIQVTDIKKLVTAPDGSLPFELRVETQGMGEQVKKALKKHEDPKGHFVKINYFGENNYEIAETRVKLSIDFIIAMEKLVGRDNVITEGI